jgi:hypothetical protein
VRADNVGERSTQKSAGLACSLEVCRVWEARLWLRLWSRSSPRNPRWCCHWHDGRSWEEAMVSGRPSNPSCTGQRSEVAVSGKLAVALVGEGRLSLGSRMILCARP